MAIFDDIKLEWQGRERVIPARRVMGAIATIEDVVTLVELQRYGERGAMPMAKLAMAYAAVLRYAGAQAGDDEVYASLFGSDADEAQGRMLASIQTLMMMMVPPEAIRRSLAAQESAPGNSEPTAARSSSKRSKQRSAKAG